ncbi:MAG TPA: NrfD/PsrC family molybdoenzyme membrane anchor subunit [Oscillatoriaceae cyanobacterium]
MSQAREPWEAPVLEPGTTYATVTDQIAAIAITGPHKRGWWMAFAIASGLLGLLVIAVWVLLAVGVGIWGVNIPVAWGFAIANFVWWIGIGHAGTFISAFLLLMRERWRASINRFAEAMTLFAVSCAGLFPLLHLGRPWFFYWLLPYPNDMDLWPQWRSPLVWDVFAVSTYLTVSLLFWYQAVIPDMAALRDRAKSRWLKIGYGILAFGWRGSAVHWQRFEMAYLMLGGLATPLVISVHSVVSFDFTIAQLPGWHSTIFPPYFVAGAIFSGFAMVLTLAIPLRAVYKLHDLVTIRHLENMGKLLLATGLIVDYSYAMEFFTAYYSGDVVERQMELFRAFGPYAFLFWIVMACNVVAPQFLWSKRVRTNVYWLFGLGLVANFGMWIERVMIVITSLSHDRMPSSWHLYWPTIWDWMTLFGSVGLFFFLYLLFIRLLPMIAIFEVRELVYETRKEGA